MEGGGGEMGEKWEVGGDVSGQMGVEGEQERNILEICMSKNPKFLKTD